MGLIVPAILPVSRKELERRLAFFAHISSVGRVQIDVVDGHLASPTSWPYNTGPSTSFDQAQDKSLGVNELAVMRREGYQLPNLDHIEYEIDLMCLDAAKAAGDWLALGASRLTFHIESVVNESNFLGSVREKYGGGGDITLDNFITFGIALNITNNIEILEPYLADIGYVQFMGIAKIGRQGQPFDPRVLEQVRAFRAKHPTIPVQVDGGVTLDHAKELRALGVSNLIVGSAILEAKDPVAALTAFEALESPYGV